MSFHTSIPALSHSDYNIKFSNTLKDDISEIQKGKLPDGWKVHHKLPLDDSGTNSFDNLVLIQNEPYHKLLTNYQNAVTKNLKVGDTKTVAWPVPNGSIYPPTQ